MFGMKSWSGIVYYTTNLSTPYAPYGGLSLAHGGGGFKEDGTISHTILVGPTLYLLNLIKQEIAQTLIPTLLVLELKIPIYFIPSKLVPQSNMA